MTGFGLKTLPYMGFFLVNDLQTPLPQKEPMVRFFLAYGSDDFKMKKNVLRKKNLWWHFFFLFPDFKNIFWAYVSDDFNTDFFLSKQGVYTIWILKFKEISRRNFNLSRFSRSKILLNRGDNFAYTVLYGLLLIWV